MLCGCDDTVYCKPHILNGDMVSAGKAKDQQEGEVP